MAKTTKKALGAAMAGVMAVGAVAGAVNAVEQVKVANAAESQAVKNAKAKISHLIYSINKNFAGLKNQATWEGYVKEAKALIAKIPSAESAQASALTAQLKGIEDTILAIARINQVEKSYETNYKGIKNAAQWNEYLEEATVALKSVDKSVFGAKYAELVERLNKAQENVKVIIDAHNAEVKRIEGEVEKAVKANDAKALQNLLDNDIKKLGTHKTTEELKAKVENLIKEVSNKLAKSITATNATTVEVEFANKVEDVNALKFSIEGLEIKNAAAKQTNDKVVVLTTAVQEGGKEYTVKLGEEVLGKFGGVSSVVPTSIKLERTAIQAKVGAEVTLKADIGQKTAGVAVTFNIDAANNSLNKDIVAEAYTDANGIASYTYTQYNAGLDCRDDVAVYATGAPAKRDLATVFWGVDTILSVKANDDKGNTVVNGANKIYTVTYKDAKTGKPVEGKKINVTFKENIDVNVDKITKATINGVNPYQLTNGNKNSVQVTTNSKGEATFTATGTNTKATPVVFLDENANGNSLNGKLDSKELQVSAEQLTFAAEQLTHEITVTRDGGEEATTGPDNGRKYKVVVKTKDGKAASGEIVNVALNENIDRIISTNTDAVIRDHKDADGYEGEFLASKGSNTGNGTSQVALKLNSKGEAEFRITSSTTTAYATPVVWIDVNTSDAREGILDEGEASKIADITYFAAEKVTSGSLKAYNGTTEVKSDKNFKGTEAAKFVFAAANQSGKAVESQPKLKASYTVFNTGTNDVKVNGQVVSSNRSYTFDVESRAGEQNAISVTTDDKTASVRVEANATATDTDNKTTYLGNKTATAKFVSTNSVSDFYTGKITNINVSAEKIYFDGKLDAVSYKDASFTAPGTASVTKEGFEALLASNKYVATYTKDSDSKVKIDLVAGYGTGGTVSSVTNGTLVLTGAGTKINSIPVGAITVTDADLNTSAGKDSVNVTVTDSANKSVVVTLTETTVNSGIFNNETAVDLSGLADGQITVTYVDAVNTTSGAVNRTTFATLNRVAPKVTGVTEGAVYGLAGATPVFTEGTATLDGAAFTSGTPVTANGGHTLVVTDASGNIATIRFTVDAIKPTFTSITMVSNNGNTAFAKVADTIKVNITASEDISQPTVTIAGHTATVTAGADAKTWVATYVLVNGDSEGSVAIKVDAKDLAGNAATQATAVTSGSTVTFDKTAPVAATEDGTADKAGTTQASDFNILVNAETGTKVTATIGGANCLKAVTDVEATIGKATLPIDITKLETGSNAIVITVTDAAGNASATFTVNVTK